MDDPTDPNITQTLETTEVTAKINSTSIKMDFKPYPNNAATPIQPCVEINENANATGVNSGNILTRAGRKLLRKKLAEGMKYEEAYQCALESVARCRAQNNLKKVRRNDPVRIRRQEDIYLSFLRSLNKPSAEVPKNKNSDGIDVGIIHSLDPQTVINSNELKLLRTAIMRKIFNCEDDSQVRFLECIDKSGWLLIKCADEDSVAWLSRQVPLIKPWEGADLKLVQGEELPKQYLCQVYVPDPPIGDRPKVDDILAGFKRMNRDLSIEDWNVIYEEISDSGRIWVFSLCRKCMSQLVALDMMPFFGFGRVKFTIIKR